MPLDKEKRRKPFLDRINPIDVALLDVSTIRGRREKPFCHGLRVTDDGPCLQDGKIIPYLSAGAVFGEEDLG
jgi:hypothetical protein